MTTEYNTSLGVFLLCLTCGLPWAGGVWFGWRLRARVQKYGMPGALIPDWLQGLLR